MEPLVRRLTKTTPYVHLNTSNKTFIISGRSIPVDAELFFKPVLNWIDGAAKEGSIKNIQFIFRFDFFNIATSRRVLFILYKLLEMQRAGCHVIIRWMYEQYDLDMLEIGQDYAVMVNHLNFIFESYDSAELSNKRILKTG